MSSNLRTPNGQIVDSEVIKRFWSKVDRSGGPDSCWPWTRLVDKDGYGKFQVSIGYRKQWHVRTHRFAMMLETKKHSEELTLHHCDNPPCCNPKHLHNGSQKKNRTDCKTRGRTAKGEEDGNAKLSNQDVISIRNLREQNNRSIASIADDFNVSVHCIWCVVTRKTWKHI